MKTFEFSGTLQASKSLLNRAQVIQAFSADLKINGTTNSRDVQFLKKALSQIGSTFDVGEGGTTFRFLAFYLSRKPGTWTLTGSSRLFSRPTKALLDILQQLSIQNIKMDQTSLRFQTQGWKWTGPVSVDLSQSSQFASGLLLSAWNLDQDLELQLSQARVSDGYLGMTIQLLQQAGMEIQKTAKGLRVPRQQKVTARELVIEQDLSSAFVVAALAAARGQCQIQNFPLKSLQPDRVFVDLFEQMNIPMSREKTTLQISRAENIHPLQVSLKEAPDLFPVLCVLLSKANGTSRIFDTPQLVHKESNRLQKTSELLTKMKVKHQLEDNGIQIEGGSHHHELFVFDPDEDHRLAFAAAVAKSMGYRMRVLHPEVVDKSFPGFWDLISGGPG
jgi:3-phosphoshikimate 1-carboxyvinyltransferase